MTVEQVQLRARVVELLRQGHLDAIRHPEIDWEPQAIEIVAKVSREAKRVKRGNPADGPRFYVMLDRDERHSLWVLFGLLLEAYRDTPPEQMMRENWLNAAALHEDREDLRRVSAAAALRAPAGPPAATPRRDPSPWAAMMSTAATGAARPAPEDAVDASAAPDAPAPAEQPRPPRTRWFNRKR